MGRIVFLVIIALLLMTPMTTAIAQADTAEITFWESVEDTTDADELDAYLKAYPDGKFAPLAKIRLKRLQKTDQASPDPKPSVEPPSASAKKSAETAFDRRDLDFKVKLGSTPTNPKRGILGIRIMNFPRDTAAALEIAETGAVFVQEVVKGSAAEAYGIAAGDVVLSVDDTTTTDMQTLVRIVSAHAPGETTTLKIVRLAKSPVEFVQAFRNEAQRPDAAAVSFFLGNIYSNGMSIAAPKDAHESLNWYRKAADRGHSGALRAVGLAYANGRGVGKDEVEAVKWYRKAAEKGDASAMTNLGGHYANGNGIEKDAAKAVSWFHKAADKGNADAMRNLAISYDNGSGVAKDAAEATNWYRKAAAKGDVIAMNGLGWKYQNGKGADKDSVEATKWYQKAADLGYADAMDNLGLMHANGNGVTKNDAEAAKWFRSAADRNHLGAMIRLGFMYSTGRGVKKDLAETLNWYKKSADKGSSDAMNRIGNIYSLGTGVEKDYAEAFKWYRKAADSGSVFGMSNLGFAYDLGQGVSKDKVQAASWYRKAADKGNTASMFNLSLLYANGEGVSKNPRKAAQYLLKAYTAGHESSRKALFRESKKWGRNTRRAVQEELRDAGVYDGSIDGQLGPGTRRAIEAYKAKKNAQASLSADSSSSSQGAPKAAARDDFGDLKDLEKLD